MSIAENPILLGEAFAPVGALFILDDTSYQTIDVKENGDLEVIPLTREGKPDLSKGPQILVGNTEVSQ